MKLCLIAFLLIFSNKIISQVNAYARVTALAGTTMTTANVNQTNHSFAVGSLVVIMQMQDNVIGANTADNVNFGNLSAISSAGLFEIRTIVSINGNTTAGFTAGTPTTIVVDAVNNTYNINTNSRVQIISFREMSTGNYTTTANINALPWDGNVGGVIAMDVPGILTLNHNISADADGFRGGAVSVNAANTTCSATPYRANNTNFAWKGEGIYRSTNTLYNNARSKILTGGGGGVGENGGGGGGGNFTTGGVGGGGWNGGPPCPANTGYGYGGISLSAQISGSRIFMGGGGGGGQQNNTVATPGGAGGGIVLIKADEITTTGSCAGRSITANGENALLAGNDGSGGGGAAGSIVFFVNTWSVNSTCDLTIQSNGGNGGSVNSGIHGGGGAGGQGVVYFNGAQPTTNITTTTLNGIPGCDNNTNPCTSLAGSASGTNNTGIITGSPNPLPIELLFFNAELIDNRKVQLSWATSSETNNDFFRIEKSLNGYNWETVLTKKGAGNSSNHINYKDFDFNPSIGLSYYRLSQVDFDGSTKFTTPRSIFMVDNGIHAFPNPATRMIRFTGVDFALNNFEVYDLFGRKVSFVTRVVDFNENSVDLDISLLSSGTYIFISSEKMYRFIKMD